MCANRGKQLISCARFMEGTNLIAFVITLYTALYTTPGPTGDSTYFDKLVISWLVKGRSFRETHFRSFVTPLAYCNSLTKPRKYHVYPICYHSFDDRNIPVTYIRSTRGCHVRSVAPQQRFAVDKEVSTLHLLASTAVSCEHQTFCCSRCCISTGMVIKLIA